jgi:hypothetical protein
MGGQVLAITHLAHAASLRGNGGSISTDQQELVRSFLRGDSLMS